MELQSGIVYLSNIQEKLESIDKNPESVITMFYNKEESIVDLLNTMYRFEFNGKHLNDFINETFRKIEELKSFKITRGGERVSLELKSLKDAPFRISCSSSFRNVITYDIFKGDLDYKREQLENLIELYLNKEIKENVLDTEDNDYIKNGRIKEDEKVYINLFEPYVELFSEDKYSFKNHLSLATKYANYFYDLNMKKGRISKKRALFYKQKTFIKVLLMKKAYYKLIKENVDYCKEKAIESYNYFKNENQQELEEKEWIFNNKDFLLESYDNVYNYLKKHI